jgi:hypothetical protein
MTLKKTLLILFLTPLISGIVAFVFIFLEYHGLFIKWQKVNPPAEADRIVKSIGLGRFQTQSGAQYALNINCYPCLDDAWVSQTSPFYPTELASTLLEKECGTFSFLPLYKYNLYDFHKGCIYYMFGTALIAFELDSDGNVYYWINAHGGEYSGIELIFFPIIFSFVGIFCGGFYVLANLIINHLRKRFRA